VVKGRIFGDDRFDLRACAPHAQAGRRGVVVNGYTSDDSPAKQAGIQPGDVIVSLGGGTLDPVIVEERRDPTPVK